VAEVSSASLTDAELERETLADALRPIPILVGWTLPWRRILATGILESDWLAARVAAARADERERLLAGDWLDGDRRDVAAWLIREANQRVKFFPQRVDGVDALVRHLAAIAQPADTEGA
jgi:hypothetical protein